MLCFLDYDGTIADDFDHINEENIKFIRTHNSQFVLSTGRNLSQIKDIFRKHDFSTDFIGGNGSFYSSGGNVNILYTLNLEVVDSIVKQLKELHTPIIIHTITDNYVVNYDDVLSLDNIKKIANEFSYRMQRRKIADEPLVKLYVDTFFNEASYMIKLDQIRSLDNITSIETFFWNNTVRNEVMNVFNTFGSSTESYYTSVEFNGEATKGAAILKFLEKQHVGFSFSVGNSSNDISMFRSTNVALKMAHSPESLPAVEIPYGPSDSYLPQIFL